MISLCEVQWSNVGPLSHWEIIMLPILCTLIILWKVHGGLNDQLLLLLCIDCRWNIYHDSWAAFENRMLPMIVCIDYIVGLSLCGPNNQLLNIIHALIIYCWGYILVIPYLLNWAIIHSIIHDIFLLFILSLLGKLVAHPCYVMKYFCS